MALKGAREPVTGVKGAKGPKRLRLPKAPRQPETETTVALGEEYLRRRNRILAIKEKREAMELALVRDELVEKALVERQLAYFTIPFRQAVLSIPTKLRLKLGDAFTHEMVQIAKQIAAETLEHLSHLPEAVDADWQERLEEEK